MSIRTAALILSSMATLSSPAFAGIEPLPEGASEFLARLQCEGNDEQKMVRVFSSRKEGGFLVEISDLVYDAEVVARESTDGGELLVLRSHALALGGLDVTLLLGMQWNPEQGEVQEAQLINEWNGFKYQCEQVAIR